MYEFNIVIPDWLISAGIVVGVILGCVTGYALIGAILAGIFNRLGWDGSGKGPPAEVAGFFWPITVVVLLIGLSCYVLCFVSWWTVFLPARGAFWLIAKRDK